MMCESDDCFMVVWVSTNSKSNHNLHYSVQAAISFNSNDVTKMNDYYSVLLNPIRLITGIVYVTTNSNLSRPNKLHCCDLLILRSVFMTPATQRRELTVNSRSSGIFCKQLLSTLIISRKI